VIDPLASATEGSPLRPLGWLSLALSGATLICCALPALLVALGAGAVLASVVSTVPGLVWLSEHKDVLFALAALGLAGAAFAYRRARALPCPTDPRLARACARARTHAGRVLLVSGAIYLIGITFAYLLPALQSA